MNNSAIKNSNVALIVPTIDRPDFVIRQLNYYARLKFPHSIYYSDASNTENSKIIKDHIAKLKDQLRVVYMTNRPGEVLGAMIQLLSAVEEKYVAYLGDDDFWVPSTLDQCAEFLEKNPDYESAIGKTIMFRLKEDSAPYSQIKVIYDYPKFSIDDELASARLFNYLGPKSCTVGNSVVKTAHYLKNFQDAADIKDHSVRTEFFTSCLTVISGKSKVLDKFAYAMQLHDTSHDTCYKTGFTDLFDLVVNNADWFPSYTTAKEKIVAALMAKDSISFSEANQAFKKCMWFFIKENFRTSFDRRYATTKQTTTRKFKKQLAIAFPGIKKIYKSYVSPILNRGRLEHEIMRPNSKYFKDFQPVLDAITQNHE